MISSSDDELAAGIVENHWSRLLFLTGLKEIQYMFKGNAWIIEINSFLKRQYPRPHRGEGYYELAHLFLRPKMRRNRPNVYYSNWLGIMFDAQI